MSDVHAESAENHHASRKFLTFLVDAVSYAVHIRHVVEIIGMQHITPLPGAPPHIRGVINLRGAVIPVMDLHARFGLPPSPTTTAPASSSSRSTTSKRA